MVNPHVRRRAIDMESFKQATQIRNLHKQKGRHFNPAEFGFVSTTAQIEQAIRRQDAISGHLQFDLHAVQARG